MEKWAKSVDSDWKDAFPACGATLAYPWLNGMLKTLNSFA